jgi:hypothetical protein
LVLGYAYEQKPQTLDPKLHFLIKTFLRFFLEQTGFFVYNTPETPKNAVFWGI